MAKIFEKRQRLWLALIFILLLGITVLGGLQYMRIVREDLAGQAAQDALAETARLQQSFDQRVSGDREWLHSFARFFEKRGSRDADIIQEQLDLFYETDAAYSVINLENGAFCSNISDGIQYLSPGELDTYRSLSGSGVREPYFSQFAERAIFGCYECFTFADGVPGLIQKSYDCAKVSETLSLSFYSGQGFACVANREGGILLRSTGTPDGQSYESISELLAGAYGKNLGADGFTAGSMTFTGNGGTCIYSCVPLEIVEDWYLISIVPQGAVIGEDNQVLADSRQAEALLVLFVIVCCFVIILIRRKYISEHARERQSQEALSEALKLARAANDAKSAFLSSVSHDIRTPMNAIIGFVALLREDADNPEAVLEYTQRIDAASSHLLELINDVLDMNKIESGNASLNVSPLDLSEIMDEVNTIIRPQTKAKEQSFEIFASALRHEHFLGDKLRVNQILINLLSNAVKYTERGGRITVRVEELPQVLANHSRLRFTVQDNGMGMSEEYQRIIFEPFTRENTDAVRNIQGSGFGMALTKSLVDLMGGSIRVESKLGEGSAFIVELELRVEEVEDDPEFWNHHKIKRMMVADGDEDACRDIVRMMADADVTVEYAADGHSVADKIIHAKEAGRPFDLLLLNWKTPALNGMETVRLIREEYRERAPILLITAFDWEEIEQEAKEVGIDHFMPKPFFMSSFKNAIQQIRGSMKRTGEDPDSQVVKGRHILVVDDIEVNQVILVKILTALGATCDTAEHGREAVERFTGSPVGAYDLILMDVQMPVMDGYAATRAIRGSGRPDAENIPIISMTANAFVEDVRDAIACGMDAHVAKPVQLDKLKQTIGEVLEKKAQNR